MAEALVKRMVRAGLIGASFTNLLFLDLWGVFFQYRDPDAFFLTISRADLAAAILNLLLVGLLSAGAVAGLARAAARVAAVISDARGVSRQAWMVGRTRGSRSWRIFPETLPAASRSRSTQFGQEISALRFSPAGWPPPRHWRGGCMTSQAPDSHPAVTCLRCTGTGPLASSRGGHDLPGHSCHPR